MNLHVNANEVAAVLLADGWHEVRAGTFVTGPFAFAGATDGSSADVGGQPGFGLTTDEGAVVMGPLSSLLAVRLEAAQDQERTPLQELAYRLDGRILTAGGAESVRFTHAGEDFEVWLGATKYGPRWLFAAAGEREGAVDYGFAEKDPVDQVARAVMGDLKAGMRPGRPGAATDHPDAG
ncbi:hypothetical protein [Streptomyces sp. CB03911]|uniref:hypothetical protein n=1 Tax=Streptomycetaceae TaxID=2062 RepID=UPI000939FBB2|nr:hypothetical protein [Streptomyces sp. CB03911]OKI19903.1 hypothetical protein A6A07_37960 [Streptomyces sp. CB03911]